MLEARLRFVGLYIERTSEFVKRYLETLNSRVILAGQLLSLLVGKWIQSTGFYFVDHPNQLTVERFVFWYVSRGYCERGEEH